MSKIKTEELIKLLDAGYRQYKGQVPPSFYMERRCFDPKKAEWFGRAISHKNKTASFICLGCSKRCCAVDPEGWQLLLEVSPDTPGAVMVAVAERLSVDELLRIKKALQIKEAAFALNVSRNTVQKMIDEGLLDTVPGTPIRVTVESVKRNLAPVA